MDRLTRAQRDWMGRRLALLAGSALIAAGAFGIQLARLKLEPDGAAVHGVALLITLSVLALLLRLVRLQLGGPGLEAPSWERHEHRASLREAPLVAVIGTGVAAFLALASPRLVAEERHRPSAPLTVDVTEPVRGIAAVSPAALSTPASMPAATAPRAKVLGPVFEPEPAVKHRPVEVNFAFLEGGQDAEPPKYDQEPIDPTRPDRNSILTVQPEPPTLPPVHIGASVMVVSAQGMLEVQGDVGRFQVDLDGLRGEQRYEAGVDITAEFALTPETALKLMYAGTAISERGHLTEGGSFGSATASAGDEYELEMKWSHLYMALAKRVTGHTRGSWFDLSVHAGAMVDHTLVEFESGASGIEAETDEDELAWVSPGVGLSMAFRGPGSAGFVFEIVQSLPVNLGGQAMTLTDIRTGVTIDLVQEVASLFVGYRYVHSLYRLYEAPFARQGGTTAAEVAMKGPVFGLDFRF